MSMYPRILKVLQMLKLGPSALQHTYFMTDEEDIKTSSNRTLAPNHDTLHEKTPTATRKLSNL